MQYFDSFRENFFEAYFGRLIDPKNYQITLVSLAIKPYFSCE
jgi:hypothetical protein